MLNTISFFHYVQKSINIADTMAFLAYITAKKTHKTALDSMENSICMQTTHAKELITTSAEAAHVSAKNTLGTIVDLNKSHKTSNVAAYILYKQIVATTKASKATKTIVDVVNGNHEKYSLAEGLIKDAITSAETASSTTKTFIN